MRPAMPYGIQSGDVAADRAVVWSRTDRPARMIVEYSTTASFRDARRIVGSAALADTDFTARVELGNLPGGQEIFYRIQFQDLSYLKTMSEPLAGRFRTALAGRRTVTFCFSGAEAGQGSACQQGTAVLLRAIEREARHETTLKL